MKGSCYCGDGNVTNVNSPGLEEHVLGNQIRQLHSLQDKRLWCTETDLAVPSRQKLDKPVSIRQVIFWSAL
jgi:hypothetical protein